MKKNYAFISYSHQDIKMAKWLHRKLEWYKLPTEIHNECEDSKYLRPVFRDQEDLDTGVLSDELSKHLQSSKYLIVICSLHSAKSEWVSKEVRKFIEWGRLEYIIPFIIDGAPKSDDGNECLPLSLREYVRDHPDRELLGISIAEVGRNKAFIRVVSRMLDVSFDELWKRHKRERRRQMMLWSVGSPLAACMLYCIAMPITLEITLNDDSHKLPIPDNAILTVNGADYPLHSLDTVININNIPGYYRGRSIPYRFSATYYEKFSGEADLGIGVNAAESIQLKRDSTFAVFAGYVVGDDSKPVIGAEVVVGDSVTHTGSNGYFEIVFKVETQSEHTTISISKPGRRTIMRDDECPSSQLKYIMHAEK